MKRSVCTISLLLTAGAWPAMSQDVAYRDPGMKKMIQVAIVCKDIEATTARWAGLLGVPKPKINTTRPGHEVNVMFRGRPSEGRVKLAFMPMGQVVLEFLEPVGGDTSWKEYLDQHGEGVQHLGFQVVDLDKTRAAMKQFGFPELHSGRYDSNDGTYVYMDTEKALGVTLELLHSDAQGR